MKTNIYLPITPSTKIMVSPGDEIDSETTIAQVPVSSQKRVIPIGSILSVQPSSITKYFIKKIGEEIVKGEIIAQKKGFLSTKMAKSPVSGKITEIDLKKGTLIISEKTQEAKNALICPVPGKVKEISETMIELEIEAKIYRGKKGEGEEVTGILKFIKCNSLSILDISCDVEKGIIACKCITDEVVAKLDVLGARGLIGTKLPQQTYFSWIQVEESVLKDLSAHDNQSLWLRPIHKEIIVYN